ncbi:hypothetical protein CVT24_005737 [Panaeolus cyanescens]|uniref:JmjC domain-containing histone demethylation protein 1 n=1 Tax=Panaeolus cyanescens TaxID=181874 RepID=A0A409V966_9AGAR|nr:hypothetical protein CVT24_005737 [Panaeolus cyanescens]
MPVASTAPAGPEGASIPAAESPASAVPTANVQVTTGHPSPTPTTATNASQVESCPACTPETREQMSTSRKESWIQCDHCSAWHHWRCAGNGEDVEMIAKCRHYFHIYPLFFDRSFRFRIFVLYSTHHEAIIHIFHSIETRYCKPCTEVSPAHVTTLKTPARKSARKKPVRDYAQLNAGYGMAYSANDPHRFKRVVEAREEAGKIKPNRFRKMQGGDLDEDWLNGERDDWDDGEGEGGTSKSPEWKEAMKEPVIIEKPDGLGMQMPPEGLTVEHVAEYIGEDVPLEVMDCATQSASPGWNLGKWADYYELEASKRDKILNVISLEISGTELADMILPPKIVRDLDWVENFWPGTRKGKGHAYPKVQLYCLMGVAGAWTDWHIDFAGSSVYYHILHGSKIFYFIRPTPANLAAYEKWSGSELQYQAWLGDMVDEVVKVELVAGNTMIIPSGWIHAVYTPVDTLVFGGNFLQSYDVAMQFRIREIEIATQVPKKFTFPMFTKLCWYVGDKYLRDLKSPSGGGFGSRVLEGVLRLSDYLVSEARMLENGNDQQKKEAKEQIPSDRVKDGPAMARELRWRVKQAMGYSSEDESGRVKRTLKRRRIDGNEPGPFRHFRPKTWDGMNIQREEEEESLVKGYSAGERPDWIEWWTGMNDNSGGKEGKMIKRRETEVRVRKTQKGIERHVIRRSIEEWIN